MSKSKVLCTECEHDIDSHMPRADDPNPGTSQPCSECDAHWDFESRLCTLSPSDIARHWIEQAKIDQPITPACPVHDTGMWDVPGADAEPCICPVPLAEYERLREVCEQFRRRANGDGVHSSSEVHAVAQQLHRMDSELRYQLWEDLSDTWQEYFNRNAISILATLDEVRQWST